MSSSLRVLRTLVVLWTMCILIGGQKTTEDNTCTNVGSVEERLKGIEDSVKQQQRVTQEMHQLLLQQQKQLLQQQNVTQQMYTQLLQQQHVTQQIQKQLLEQQNVPQPMYKQLLEQQNVTQQMQKQLLEQQNITQQMCNQPQRMMNSSQTQYEKDVQQQNITQQMYKQLLQEQNITQHMCKQPLQMMNETQYGQGGTVYLSAIGQAVDIAAGRGNPRAGTGGWLLDPAEPDGKAWEFSGDRLYSMTQYASKANMINKENPVTIQLDKSIEGSGHVILDGYLYGSSGRNCYEEFNSFIFKMDIRQPTAVKTVKTTFLQGVYSDYVVDLAVDELGLWAVYPTRISTRSLSIAIARIDPHTMTITGTWVTRRQTSERRHIYAFMISGILYIIDQNNPAKKKKVPTATLR